MIDTSCYEKAFEHHYRPILPHPLLPTPLFDGASLLENHKPDALWTDSKPPPTIDSQQTGKILAYVVLGTASAQRRDGAGHCTAGTQQSRDGAVPGTVNSQQCSEGAVISTPGGDKKRIDRLAPSNACSRRMGQYRGTSITLVQCPLCPYNTYNSHKLKVHMRVHTQEKPFACEHCEYKSSQRSNLNTHMKKQHLQEWLRQHT